jgi:RsiW-degrading membrane proteinase PrsW (M82 family)
MFHTQWHVLFFGVVLLLASGEFGFRVGRHLFADHDEARKSQIGGVQGAVLGLLALLLGFTFSMAVQRYDTRRTLVVQEANAVGTTFLRAALLPGAHPGAVQDLLRRYVDERLAFYEAGAVDDAIAVAERNSAEMQTMLWRHAVEAGREAPTPVTATFIVALNEMIDLDATQIAAMQNRVPGVVWALLLIVAVSGCVTCGYAAGATGKRAALPMLLLPLLLGIVLMTLVDFSAPRRGFIGVDQGPLRMLKSSLAATGTK